ncbi:hypothetical protein ACFQX6_67085 [Streptosporangium lutulentum]
MRNVAEALLRAQAESFDDTDDIYALRAELNAIYDAYVDRYGPYNQFKLIRTGHTDPETGEDKYRRDYDHIRRHISDDSIVASLEIFDEKTQIATKQEVFTQRVVGRNDPPLGVESAEDALAVSFDQHGEVRMEYVAWLLGCEQDEALKLCEGLIYTDPATGNHVAAATYLSGDVRKSCVKHRWRPRPTRCS